MRKFVVGVVVVLAAIFVLIQFVPVSAGTNPPVEVQITWDSPQTEALVRGACMDCHSNETRWPWYSRIAPVSWLVARDVEEGRSKVNFSTGHFELDELIEEIESGAMPLPIYKPLHPEANLSAEQRQQLIAGLEASLSGVPGTEGDND